MGGRCAIGALCLAVLAVAALASCPAAGAAEPTRCAEEPPTPVFGLCRFDVTFADAEGASETEAGAHPFSLTTELALNSHLVEYKGNQIPHSDGDLKDLVLAQIPGLVADPTAVPPCPASAFAGKACPRASQIGTTEVLLGTSESGEAGEITGPEAVYDLTPPPGALMRIGFHVSLVPVVIDVTLSHKAPYVGIARLANVSDILPFLASTLTLWGVPADSRHDAERGGPVEASEERPLLTLPRACEGPLKTTYEADSWQGPGVFLEGFAETHDDLIPPSPQGFGGCGKLGFAPTISARATTAAASSASGLDFSLDVADEGLGSAAGRAASDIRKTVVTLPRGMTVNPSIAEGLAVCSRVQLEGESVDSAPGQGCPEASKIGTVEVETPLLQGTLLTGQVFQATPYENPTGSLIALYVVIREAQKGIFVVQPLKVEPDPATGQLVAIAEEMPQLPFSEFRFHFREGARAPLISPPGCGTFQTEAKLYPWSGIPPVTSTSSFQIQSGPNGAPCPAGPPFHPGFEAGSLNAAAKAFSPFYMRLTRNDGEADISRFSAVLPPGVVGKIAGVGRCPEAAIARAKARTGPHGGEEELHDPSCPAASAIGRTIAAAGVGSQLTHVPGSLYLAGPYHGDPLSVVSITPAVAGPFDAGTVVVREALTLNPITARVEVDGAASDPIPHILKGIPLNLREIEVYADKPEFTLNPTSCAREEARATLWGAGTSLAPAPETPLGLTAPYQAVNCAKLGFKPKLQIQLKGGTKRGAHPALKAIVAPRAEDANFQSAIVTLPHSAFLDQAHIRTICTRVQFAAAGGNGAGCPPASVYGKASAWSPLLEEPLSGPVYLRSSSHNLPDLVVALHGLVDIDLAARIDSKDGGIRSTFEAIPDAPVSKFVLQMEGGKKGLIVNSTDLCRSTNRAAGKLTGQNGRLDEVSPEVKPSCGKKHRKSHRHHHKRKGRR